VYCCAVLRVQHRCKIPEVQRCQQLATFRCNNVSLCGTHVNSPPDLVVVPFRPIATTEKI
jgi:hypothetical protein